MIQYELSGTDVADIRFAVSPLTELVLSLRAWRDPGRYPIHTNWMRSIQDARPPLAAADVLLALTNDTWWTPDSLTPKPGSPLTRIEEEFEQLARLDPERLAHDLRVMYPDGTLPPALRGSAATVKERVMSALDEYWQRCFQPVWPRMRAILEGDVTYRGRQLAHHGLAGMFADVSEGVELVGTVVHVGRWNTPGYAVSAADGLTLMPTLWTRYASAPISPDEPPLILYAARGLGTLWEGQRLSTSGALRELIGAPRAGLLEELGTPASSTELAVRLGVSTSAVNQHLRALKACGLLHSARHGRSVLYRRSDLGDELTAAATTSR